MPPNAIRDLRVNRCEANPLIVRSEATGRTINGPSVIRVPPWIRQPLGQYYLYFADHAGGRIHLAYADALPGPWTIHEPGILTLGQAAGFAGHIASPDVHVDDDRREIRLYFHGGADGDQRTGVATSGDGLTFTATDTRLGPYYFRVFRWHGACYALFKTGNTGWGGIGRSPDGLGAFAERPCLIPRMRHAAVLIRDGHLLAFHSRVGDAPERIVVSTVRLTDDWRTWQASAPLEVLRPERDYEGIAYPDRPSQHGPATEVRQLRDPCIFEEDGRISLFYAIGGEMGIARAEIELTMQTG